MILNHDDDDDIAEQTLRVFMMTTMMMLLMMTKLLKQRSNCNCITVQVIGPGSSANTIQVTDHHHHHHRFDNLDDFDHDEELRTPSFSCVFVYSSLHAFLCSTLISISNIFAFWFLFLCFMKYIKPIDIFFVLACICI